MSDFDFDVQTTDKEQEGVWQEYGGGKFLIAHMGSVNFQRVFATLQRPYKRQIDKDKLDPETALDIMCKALARATLLDWKNVSSKGQTVTYSRENAEALLRRNSSFRKFVQDFALDVENYIEEAEEVGK